MTKALRHRVCIWTSALLLAVITTGPVGALVIAVGQPHCTCPGHVPTPLQEPTFGPCGDEAKAVAAASPSALPNRPAAIQFLPTVIRLASFAGLRPESRLPLPETPPPRSLRA